MRENDYPSLKLKHADKWKLIWPKSGAPANYRSTIVLEPGQICSDTFIGCWFNSRQQVENFRTYFQTLFYRFSISETATDHNAISLVHRHLPDLVNIKNPRTGMIGWDSTWTDSDIEILLKDVLTEEDWQYIKKIAIEKDPVSRRQAAGEAKIAK